MEKLSTKQKHNTIDKVIEVQVKDLEFYLRNCLEIENTKELIVTVFKKFIDKGQIFEVDEHLCIQIIADYIKDNFIPNQNKFIKKNLYCRFEKGVLYSGILDNYLSDLHCIDRNDIKKENLLPIEEVIKHLLYFEFGSRFYKWTKDEAILEVVTYQRENLTENINKAMKYIAYDESYNKLRSSIITNEVDGSTKIEYIKELIISGGRKTDIEDLALIYAIDEFKHNRLQNLKKGIKKSKHSISGYIYAMTNECFKEGYVKVGKTSRNPRVRAMELSQTTAVPGEYKVMCSLRVNDITLAEKFMHITLKNRDKHLDKEFFLTDKEEIEKLFELYSIIENYIRRAYIPISSFSINDNNVLK